MYIENFTSKNLKFLYKNSCDILQMSDKNIDCLYSLEPPWRVDSNEYPQTIFLTKIRKHIVYPCKPGLLYKSGVYGGQIL